MDYLTFEEGFQFKVLSQRHDIVIVFAIDGNIGQYEIKCNIDQKFATDLYQAAEGYLVKCWMSQKNTSNEQIQNKIASAKG